MVWGINQILLSPNGLEIDGANYCMVRQAILRHKDVQEYNVCRSDFKAKFNAFKEAGNITEEYILQVVEVIA